MDFTAELKKLLKAEETPPLDPLAELTHMQLRLFDAISKRNSDVSLQMEEVYEIVKEADENAREIRSAAKRESLLLGSLIALDDLLDAVLELIRSTDIPHVETIAAKRDELLNTCGIERTSELRQHLNPRLHTVIAAEESDAPVESIIRIVENGYEYRGNVIRKASVIISKGNQ